VGVYNLSFLPTCLNQPCLKPFANDNSRSRGMTVAALLLVVSCLPAMAAVDSGHQLGDNPSYIAKLLSGAGILEMTRDEFPGPNLLLVDKGRLAAVTENSESPVASESPAKPVVNDSRLGSRFGLAFKSSTLGLGADFGIRLARPVNLRLGFSGFNYSRTVADGDIAYLGTLHLRSLQTVVDWFPWSRAIHFSPGLLLYNDNRVTANALIPTGKTLTSGAEVFISNPQNPITGSAKSAMRRVAPMMLFGFGNLVPRARRFSFSSDFGVVFQGQPTTNFALIGSACDTSGVHCRNVAHDPSIQADVRSGEQTMRDDLSIMKYYPVISVGFGYHF
jgi:hypothetical protein